MGKQFSISARQQLNDSDLAAIKELESSCNSFEGLRLRLNWGMLRERKPDETNDFLCHDSTGRLIGFLALYGFGRAEMEVSGMVHPSYRRSGVFSALLDRAAAECRKRDVKSLLFFYDRNSTSGTAFVKQTGSACDHSEYRMELPGDMPPVDLKYPVDVRRAEPSDFDMLAELDSICFGIPVEESKTFYKENSLLDSDELYIAVLDGKEIGMFKLYKEKNEIMIFGFGIKPEYRGRGYGRATLGKAVNTALARRPAKVSLEVDCVNETALSLYKSCGFEIITAYDYYRLPV